MVGAPLIACHDAGERRSQDDTLRTVARVASLVVSKYQISCAWLHACHLAVGTNSNINRERRSTAVVKNRAEKKNKS